MDKEQKPRLIDQLPLIKYTNRIHKNMHTGDIIDVEQIESIHGEYVMVEDVENFLQKFTDPAVLNKIVKSLMFGSKLDFKDIIKWNSQNSS